MAFERLWLMLIATGIHYWCGLWKEPFWYNGSSQPDLRLDFNEFVSGSCAPRIRVLIEKWVVVMGELRGDGLQPLTVCIDSWFSPILDIDFEELSGSRQTIEERLVEEYRNCSYFRDTQVELERITQGKQYTTKPTSRTITYNSSFFTQLHWVLGRTFRNLALNPQTSVAQVRTHTDTDAHTHTDTDAHTHRYRRAHTHQ